MRLFSVAAAVLFVGLSPWISVDLDKATAVTYTHTTGEVGADMIVITVMFPDKSEQSVLFSGKEQAAADAKWKELREKLRR